MSSQPNGVLRVELCALPSGSISSLVVLVVLQAIRFRDHNLSLLFQSGSRSTLSDQSATFIDRQLPSVPGVR